MLSRETGFPRDYGRNPYVGYDRVDRSPFLFFGKDDNRLLAMERVAALTVGEASAAFPFSLLEAKGVVHHTVGGQDLVVFFQARRPLCAGRAFPSQTPKRSEQRASSPGS